MADKINIKLDNFTPEKRETKNIQAHFLLTASNAKKLQSLATAQGISKNELINKIIEKL